MTPASPHPSLQPPVLRLTAASAGYGGIPVLHGADLAIDSGDVVAILGPNGSGKSTLVRALLGLSPLLSGRLELYGVAERRFRSWERIGYVPQRLVAAGVLPASVGEVVTSGRLSSMRRFRPMRAADRQAVRDALDQVDLAGYEHEAMDTLSGGQQRRVLVARALVGEPEVLLLDEPFAGVDLPSQDAIALALQRLVSRGATVVAVAHELGPLEPLLTRVVTLSEGRIAYDGPLSGAPSTGEDREFHCLPAEARPVLRLR